MKHNHGTCPEHGLPLMCAACMGAEGGSVTSRAKAEAARINGAKGGRPKGKKKPKPS
jgi:hypothetical protein